VTRADAPRIIEIYSYYVLNTPATFETEVPTDDDYERRIERIIKFFPFFVIEEARPASSLDMPTGGGTMFVQGTDGSASRRYIWM
jgi:hypothetical protein